MSTTLTRWDLVEGQTTDLGTIDQVSLTAVRIGKTWYPFSAIVGTPEPVAGLVIFADGSRYAGRK